MNLSSISSAVMAQLAPEGVLSAAVYLGNFLLVTGRSSTGEPTGIAPDICRAIAKRLDVPLDLTGFKTQDEVINAAACGSCGIVLVGSDPARAQKVTFTPAYVELEATYLVLEDSTIRDVAQVDQPGMRIASFHKSAYDLWLQRNLKHATLAHAPSLQASNDLFMSDRLDALAGLKTGLVAIAQKVPGLRVLEGRFTGIQQAIATKKANVEAVEFLSACVEDFIRSGLVTNLIRQHEVQGLSAAPIYQTPEI
jgi:polar amino acid transport system substrate-binding protein